MHSYQHYHDGKGNTPFQCSNACFKCMYCNLLNLCANLNVTVFIRPVVGHCQNKRHFPQCEKPILLNN